MMNNLDIPEEWTVREDNDSKMILLSEDRKKKIEIEELSFARFDDPLPRIEGYKTENPYHSGMGEPVVQDIVRPEEGLNSALEDAISNLQE